MTDPAAYHAWYSTPRGAWMGAREFALMRGLLRPAAGASLLDVGCGTGYFSSRFADLGLAFTGLDASAEMLSFARRREPRPRWVRGDAERLPFDDGAFDYAAAITSLCFVANPQLALQEAWRISRQAVILGLLHRRSLLWWSKHAAAGYAGARWDTLPEIRAWAAALRPPAQADWGFALFLPSGDGFARRFEAQLPSRLPLGGFMAVCLRRS